MNKLMICMAVALLQAANALAAEPEYPVVTVTVGNAAYAIPQDFLGHVVAHPEQPQGIVVTHVHYPDLAPVGNASGKCPRKIALTDETCPYFSIFIEPDDQQLPKDYDGLIRNLSLKRQATVEGFEVFPYVAGTVYRWTENGETRTFNCSDLTCETWGRTEHGGAYRIVFLNSWWRDGRRLNEASAALVDRFRLAAELRK